MNRRMYETERLRGVHLSIIIVLTLCVLVVIATGLSMNWDENWVLPFLAGAVLLSWVFHIRQTFSAEVRLIIYAGVGVAVILFDGVQFTSVFDFAISIALAMTLFSQANNRNLLHLFFAAYLFLLARHISLLVTGRGVTVTNTVIAELVIHTLIILVIYRIALDIVRRRVSEAESDAQEILNLKELQKHTEDFLTNVSHELRTPINAVTGIGSVMVREAETEESAKLASSIFSAGRWLSIQVEDMLDYTEIDTGKIVISEEAYAVTSLVNDVVSECGFYEKELAESVTVEIAEGIPDRLLGGGRWVKKLLLHQIDTALRLADGKDVTVRVLAKPREYGINLCMDVGYKGACISRAMRERILGEVLFAEKEARSRLNTFDLSVRIVFGLAHAMGGFVRLKQDAGGDARIHVSIPQRIDYGREDAKEALTSATTIRVRQQDILQVSGLATSGVMQKEIRALVVDDEPMNLIVAESILSEYGMKIETAGSGEEAIAKVQETGYDVIFMDHMMPVMDGVEAAHRIRRILTSQDRDTRIVALTANAVSGAREMFIREGFDGFVAKPVERKELTRTLKTLSLTAQEESGAKEP